MFIPSNSRIHNRRESQTCIPKFKRLREHQKFQIYVINLQGLSQYVNRSENAGICCYLGLKRKPQPHLPRGEFLRNYVHNEQVANLCDCLRRPYHGVEFTAEIGAIATTA